MTENMDPEIVEILRRYVHFDATDEPGETEPPGLFREPEL